MLQNKAEKIWSDPDTPSFSLTWMVKWGNTTVDFAVTSMGISPRSTRLVSSASSLAPGSRQKYAFEVRSRKISEEGCRPSIIALAPVVMRRMRNSTIDDGCERRRRASTSSHCIVTMTGMYDLRANDNCVTTRGRISEFLFWNEKEEIEISAVPVWQSPPLYKTRHVSVRCSQLMITLALTV